MESTDSSDSSGDSLKSIPRPDFEALSAIDSPQPQLQLQSSSLDGHIEMESVTVPSKRQKYVVSAPPGSANGSSHSSSSSPSNINVGSSLTMKLTKVQSSTPNKAKVAKEMLALQRSHIESEVLSNFVTEVSKFKRRKSRNTPGNLATQASGGELSRSLNATTDHNQKSLNMALKRSKSIPAPILDSDDDWQDEEIDSGIKSCRPRGRSMACDDGERLAELNVEDSISDPPEPSLTRCRSRSKTLSLSNSWSNEEKAPRRGNLRSENEEFAKKHSAFMNRIIHDDQESELAQHTSVEGDPDIEWPVGELEAQSSLFSDASDSKMASAKTQEEEAAERLVLMYEEPPTPGWDPFCWKCRQCGKLMACSKCLRSFHTYCVRPATTKFDSSWKCPECQVIEAAPKRLRRNGVSVDLLSQLLSFALDRMKHVRGAHKLRSPQEVFPLTYKKYFVNPVSFESLAQCIRDGAYQTTEEFLGEVKWMQHNALILDAGDAKVEQASKALVKVCRQEANEIDTCPECYLNANSSDEWFVKVCRHPHLLLWAKLKGFPYWPAKAMGSTNAALVNVRFFGKHDRAFVPVKDCFLYSAQNPNTQTSRRSARDLAECVREVEVHIEQIKRKIGAFNYAAFRTAYDPLEEQQQLEQMMPGVYAAIDRELEPANKTPLQFLIRKTADDKLSIVKKTKATESGNESDQSPSPTKKLPEVDIVAVAGSGSSDHSKLKSNNYEVISRSGESLTDSRCKVLLKRKSLAAKIVSASVEAPEVVATKRKHSQSDASFTSESSEHKRKSKHSRKQPEQDKQCDGQGKAAIEPTKSPKPTPHEEKSQDTEMVKETPTRETSTSSPGPSASVISVVELVKRRQGVTITKIPREQQQAAAAEDPAPTPAPPPTAPLPTSVTKPNAPKRTEAANPKQSEVERQQQQLIKKVIPFIEIKTEVMSEPEDEEMAVRPTSIEPPVEQLPLQQEQQESITAQPESQLPAHVAAPQPKPVEHPPLEEVRIKEEILSEDEMETDQISVSHRFESMPPMPLPMPPPPPLPPREETPATDDLVRFVGDTTIQRVNQKQSLKTTDFAGKRKGVQQVPPQTVPQTSSPAHSPVQSAAPSPSASPKQSSTFVVGKPVPPPPKGKSPSQQQFRTKNDRTLASPPGNAAPATTTSSLLRSNMVVIPVEQPSSSNQHSPMTIPVPPLRAVSKSTLQNTSTQPTPPSVPLTCQHSSSISMPPPLAGLSIPQMAVHTSQEGTTTNNGEPVGLLASALNGLTGDNVPSETIPNDPITPGLATAWSEMLLRSGVPKLVARPCGPLRSDGSQIYPSQAGPVSQKLKENAHKITDYFISVIEDTLSDMATGDQSVLQARIAGLSLENERLKQHYERQINDVHRTSELMIAEMRKTLEQDHKRVISDLRQQNAIEQMRAVEEAKKKQWCANCMREAQLYCCWNTSYCDYPCQQLHWPRHSATCGQAVPPTHPVPPTALAPVIEPGRSKSKVAMPTATPPMSSPSPSSQIIRTAAACTPAAPVASAQSSKKWPPMMTLLNQPNPEAVLKLPATTYLRPVVSTTMTATVTAPASANNNSNSMNAVMTPSPSAGSHLSNLMSAQRNPPNFNPKPANQTMPVQRFNIPLPITVNTNAPFMIAEQHQKQVPKATGRSSGKNNSRMRQMYGNNINNSNPQGMRGSNNPQAMRQNQMNQQVFQP
ncbi:protein kinase C-binding protein 1 [Drosophila subpulchrella]|uniref:protein kinase C-binding protein 1 n=1 Tax=Drosophila subpulchrella TaxID=1486046 RepID=UPI0018A18A4F|nr:protein kinase C-binding protein 1 [Drosophila subpulchrella]XP_037710503.1 protein kinase C-binding protein 1 [Drosophila subpulchrella]